MNRRGPVRALPLAGLMLAMAGTLASGGCASIPLPEREGVVLYRAKCKSCHRTYAPQEFDVAHWEKQLPVMSRRAKLTPEEYESIRKYVLVSDVGMLPSHDQATTPPR